MGAAGTNAPVRAGAAVGAASSATGGAAGAVVSDSADDSATGSPSTTGRRAVLKATILSAVTQPMLLSLSRVRSHWPASSRATSVIAVPTESALTTMPSGASSKSAPSIPTTPTTSLSAGALLSVRGRVTTLTAVAAGAIVGTGVAVGGTGVAVAVGVAVGGTGVAVGGTGVGVGGTGVAVGGTGVAVAGTAVGCCASPAAGASPIITGSAAVL